MKAIKKGNERIGKLRVNTTYPGTPLEKDIALLMETGSGIDKVVGISYANEYSPAADIRTDRFEIALDGAITGNYITAKEKRDMLAKKTAEENEAKLKAEHEKTELAEIKKIIAERKAENAKKTEVQNETKK
jgi:VIT1/CCC1 family predicted Fe2+/Mn2+ transporter